MDKVIKEAENLVGRFKKEFSKFTSASSSYSEMETRVEFIDPFFELLGWDMVNKRGILNSLKDVIREESQLVESNTKRPDYTFRIAGQRKFFVEAKKPSVDISRNKESAFQVRRYGWSAGLPISVLTNFHKIRIYDTSQVPDVNDTANVGLLLEIDYLDLPKKLNEIIAKLSRDAVVEGSIEAWLGKPRLGTLPVNSVFLERINHWRLAFASDLKERYKSLGLDELNDIVQKIINRLIFIRMCEDRGIEGADKLRKVASKKDFIEIQRLFKEMDERYDTGLFDATLDPLQKKFSINAQLFLEVVEDLYFPKAPYSFSVLDADFLGQVYELFLTQRLAFDSSGKLVLHEKPAYENREIVTTPQPLVDEIVHRTVDGLFANGDTSRILDFNELKKIRIMDIAVGSSRFLLRAFDDLVDRAILYFSHEKDMSSVYEHIKGEYRLAFDKKRDLLLNCLNGIDIDYNAVEVARFSLLVKLLEEENGSTIPNGKHILPNLDKNIIWGNSVVDTSFKNLNPEIMSMTRPLDWQGEFDAIVCNPPYLKTEEMVSKTPDEFKYYKDKYFTPFKQFDKYFIFIEKAVKNLRSNGRVGMVVPNKWITIGAGAKLRGFLSKQGLIAEIVDFGNELVFDGKSTYVCLLLLSKKAPKNFYYSHVNNYEEWLKTPSHKGIKLDSKLISHFGANAWILPADEIEAKTLSKLFSNSTPLGKICDVFNGVQTSAEDVYAIQEWEEIEDGLIQFNKKGRSWKLEKAITRPYLIESEKHVRSYLGVEADCRLIFPYDINDEDEAVLITPKEMMERFPKAFEYLKINYSRLSDRDIAPSPVSLKNEFYRYGRHQSLTRAFISPKIILSVNQLGDKYGIDVQGIGIASGGTAGEIGIANPKGGYSLEFILALLNQRAIEYFCRKRGSPFRGGYYSRGTAVLEDVPVPIIDFKDKKQKALHDLITKDVQKVISYRAKVIKAIGRNRELLEGNIITIQNRIKKAFSQLFGLKTDDEIPRLPGEN